MGQTWHAFKEKKSKVSNWRMIWQKIHTHAHAHHMHMHTRVHAHTQSTKPVSWRNTHMHTGIRIGTGTHTHTQRHAHTHVHTHAHVHTQQSQLPEEGDEELHKVHDGVVLGKRNLQTKTQESLNLPSRNSSKHGDVHSTYIIFITQQRSWNYHTINKIHTWKLYLEYEIIN